MNIDKIWITGVSGRLGSILYQYLNPMDIEILATDKDVVDIRNSKEVNDFAIRNRPNIIINCSGISSRDECEDDYKKAFLLNSIGAKYIAIAANKIKAKLVHISTADVFDGNTISPYTEFDIPSPTTVYGKSKLLGEKMVQRFCTKHFILRTSRLYSRENRYIENIIEEAKTGVVKVPKAQFASPTSAYELAKFIIYIINTSEYGTYHASCTGFCSRKEFAKKVLKLMNIDAVIEEVYEYDSVDFKPQYTALENLLLNITGSYTFPSWSYALEKYIEYEVNNV